MPIGKASTELATRPAMQREIIKLPLWSTKKFPNKQKGLSMWGILGVSLMIAGYAIFFFKLFPVYLDGWAVEKVLQNLEKEPEIFGLTKNEIVQTVQKRTIVNGVTTMPPKSIKVTETKKAIVVSATYESRVSVVGNLDVVVMFDYSVEGKEP